MPKICDRPSVHTFGRWQLVKMRGHNLPGWTICDIREEALNHEITALLKPFALRTDWTDAILTRVNEEKKQAAQSVLQLAAQKRAEIDKINARLQWLLDSFLDELIDRETFTAEKAKWMSRKKTLEEQTAHLTAGRADWLEPFKE